MLLKQFLPYFSALFSYISLVITLHHNIFRHNFIQKAHSYLKLVIFPVRKLNTHKNRIGMFYKTFFIIINK